MRALNMVTDEERELKLTTEHSASSYGIPVLVDVESGEAIDAFSFACYTITEATEEEIQQLHQFGYM
jgi:hypothetical protein